MSNTFLKKLNSNKGSTLVTAIIILVVVIILSTSLMYILMSNSRKSVNSYFKKVEEIRVENTIYDVLKDLSYSESIENNIVIVRKEVSYTYTITISSIDYSNPITVRCISTNSSNDVEISIECSVLIDTVNHSYSILSWR